MPGKRGYYMPKEEREKIKKEIIDAGLQISQQNGKGFIILSHSDGEPPISFADSKNDGKATFIRRFISHLDMKNWWYWNKKNFKK